MKVVQVTHRYPPRTGGIERHVEAISEGLVDRGHDVTVITADRASGLARVEQRNGVDIRRYRAVAPGDAFYLAPGVVAGVRKADGDIVHAHNFHALPLLFAALAVRDERFVVTPHYHGRGSTPLRDWLLSAYRRPGKWCLSRADAVIGVSEWERDRLVETFGVDSVVVPNGVNAARFRAATPERRNRPYLLCVGRLAAYKGFQHAVAAIDRLPTYELVVVGSGPYRADLAAAAERAGVAGRVTLLGEVDEPRLAALYAGAEVHLALSSVEAYGMTVGEALAAGTPCVVRRAGALGEWERYAGCVGTECVDADAVAAAVRKAVDTEPAAVLPTWDDAVESLLAIYAGKTPD